MGIIPFIKKLYNNAKAELGLNNRTRETIIKKTYTIQFDIIFPKMYTMCPGAK